MACIYIAYIAYLNIISLQKQCTVIDRTDSPQVTKRVQSTFTKGCHAV